MITFVTENLIHFFFAFLWLLAFFLGWACRRLLRRERIALGIRP